MWFVFRTIHFEDRLLYLGGPDGKEVVRAEVVEIVGSWQEDPVRYRPEGGGEERTIARGTRVEELTVDVEPGFLTYWRNMDPALFALGVLLFCLTVVIAGARWWWLLRVNGTDVSLRETLRYTWIGVFFNNVVPGATGGDLIKALYIMKRCPGHRVQVLVSVVVDRVLGLGSLALLGAVVVLFALDRFAEVALGIWGVILGVGALGLVAFSRRLRRLVRLQWLLHRLPHKVRSLLMLVDQAVFFYRDHPLVISWSLLAGVGNHVLSVLCVLCIGDAIGVGMPPFEYFVLVPVINIVTALPIAPNGWGWGELLYGQLFGKYGAAHVSGVANAEAAMATRGVALSVLYRLVLTATSLIGGVLVLFEKDRVTRDDIDREVALEEREADDAEGDDAVDDDAGPVDPPAGRG